MCVVETVFYSSTWKFKYLFYFIWKYTLRHFKYSIFVESGSRKLVNSRIVKELTRCSVTSMMQVTSLKHRESCGYKYCFMWCRRLKGGEMKDGSHFSVYRSAGCVFLAQRQRWVQERTTEQYSSAEKMQRTPKSIRLPVCFKNKERKWIWRRSRLREHQWKNKTLCQTELIDQHLWVVSSLSFFSWVDFLLKRQGSIIKTLTNA